MHDYYGLNRQVGIKFTFLWIDKERDKNSFWCTFPTVLKCIFQLQLRFASLSCQSNMVWGRFHLYVYDWVIFLKFNAIRHLAILHRIPCDYNSVITQCLLEVYNSLAMQEVIMTERMVYDRL